MLEDMPASLKKQVPRESGHHKKGLEHFRCAKLAQGLCHFGTRVAVKSRLLAFTLCQFGITSEFFDALALCQNGRHIYNISHVLWLIAAFSSEQKTGS